MYNKDSPETIQSMFDSIAHNYDLTNTILSFSLHKRWNRIFVEHMHNKTNHNSYIDLCAGTGDIAFNYLINSKLPCQAHLVDFSAEMLEIAKHKQRQFKFSQHNISYLQADVHTLPFPNNFSQCATMAYGIRNTLSPIDCMHEIFRVLKPGGRFGILELTLPSPWLLRVGHGLYLRTLMPLLGKLLTNNQQAYEYLRQSIHTFISPKALEELLKQVGFIDLQQLVLSCGIATIFIGHKPIN